MGAVTAESCSLEIRLDALESREQIRETLFRYCRGLDLGDEDAVQSCFWPEATQGSDFQGGLSSEFAPLGALLSGRIKGVWHAITNVVIELAGDLAISESHFAVIHRRPATDGLGEGDFFLEGRFLDHFERRGGEWRIIHRQDLNDVEPACPAPDQELVRSAWRHALGGIGSTSLRRVAILHALNRVLPNGISFGDGEPLDDSGFDEEREIQRRIEQLTPQQRTVLKLVLQGKLNKQIAFELDVSVTTVKAHVSAVLTKLQVFSRTQAVILVNKVGLGDGAPPPSRH